MAKKIAIVDDDQNICRFLSESLKLKGYGVDTFGSAEDGLKAILTGEYQLALLDIRLPGRSGLDLCRDLRGRPETADVPIVLMSAFHKDPGDIRRARQEFGATDYLTKPFGLSLLHDTVRTLIGSAADTPSPRPLRIDGTLAETPLPRLLHDLYTLKSTGLLHLQRDERRKIIYFREGYPIFARSNLLRECLGQMLVKDGFISEAQCRESLQRVRDTGRLQGTVLLDMGLLSPEQLHACLGRQVTEKLLEVFSWPDGRYRFIQARAFKKGITAIELSPAALILQGLRHHVSESRVKALLAPHRHRYLAQSSNPHYRFQDMRLGRRDTEVLAMCSGTLTLEDLLARYPLSRHEVEEVLAALLAAQIIEGREQPATDESSVTHALHQEPEESRVLRRTILADYARMREQDHFELLGIAKGASGDEIRHAYFAMAKKFHPDRFAQSGLSEDLQDRVNELFQRLGEAYQTLSDPRSRRDYAEVRAGRARPGKKDVADIMQAETAFQKGLVFLRNRNYPEAADAFSWAAKLSPGEAEYLTQHAWARFKTNPGDARQRDEVQQSLKHSLDLNPRIDRTHLYLGYLLKREGREREAEKRFEMAVKCNPRCTDALRELRLMNMRRSRENRSLFSRVFKKSE